MICILLQHHIKCTSHLTLSFLQLLLKLFCDPLTCPLWGVSCSALEDYFPSSCLMFHYGNEVTVMLIISKCPGFKTVSSPLRLLMSLFHGSYYTEKNKLGTPGCIIRNYREEMIWHRSPQHLSRFSFVCCLSLATAKLKIWLYAWHVSIYEDAWMYMHLFIIFKMIIMLQLQPFLLGFDQKILLLSSEVGSIFLRSNVLDSLFERNFILRANLP